MSCRSCSRPMATTPSSFRFLRSWCWKCPSDTPSKRGWHGMGEGGRTCPAPLSAHSHTPLALSPAQTQAKLKEGLVLILTVGPGRHRGTPKNQSFLLDQPGDCHLFLNYNFPPSGPLSTSPFFILHPYCFHLSPSEATEEREVSA